MKNPCMDNTLKADKLSAHYGISAWHCYHCRNTLKTCTSVALFPVLIGSNMHCPTNLCYHAVFRSLTANNYNGI